MNRTEHFNMNQPEPSDLVDITKLSENFGIIDQPLFNGQTTYEFAQSLTDPEYAGSRPTINVNDLNVEGTAFFAAGAGATFTPSAQLQVRTATPAEAGKIMVADANNVVKQSTLDVADAAAGVTAGNAAKDVTDAMTDPEYVGSRPTINVNDLNVEGTAFFADGAGAMFTPSAQLQVRTATPAEAGKIMVADANNVVKQSTFPIGCSACVVNTSSNTIAKGTVINMNFANGTAIPWSVGTYSNFAGFAGEYVSGNKMVLYTRGNIEALIYSTAATTFPAGTIFAPYETNERPYLGRVPSQNPPEGYPIIMLSEELSVEANTPTIGKMVVIDRPRFP